MTTRIQTLISQLKAKFDEQHRELVAQRIENENITIELKQAKVLVSDREEQVFLLEQEVNRLKSQVNSLVQENEERENNIVSTKNEEIDGLVREIENCIDLLKQ